MMSMSVADSPYSELLDYKERANRRRVEMSCLEGQKSRRKEHPMMKEKTLSKLWEHISASVIFT